MSCSIKKDDLVFRLDGSYITKDSLTADISRLMSAAKVHGMAISLFNNNQVVYERTFGYREFHNKVPLLPSTNLYGASFSKAVFGVLIMKLVEEGLIFSTDPHTLTHAIWANGDTRF